MCELKRNPIYKAIRLAYSTCDYDYSEQCRGKTSLYPPSLNVLYNYIKLLESSSEKPEDVLKHILIGMAKQMDGYYCRLVEVEKEKLRTHPIK